MELSALQQYGAMRHIVQIGDFSDRVAQFTVDVSEDCLELEPDQLC